MLPPETLTVPFFAFSNSCTDDIGPREIASLMWQGEPVLVKIVPVTV